MEKLTIVIPAYNEQSRLPAFLDSLAAYIKQHPGEIDEIIAVDDGSTDDTAGTARAYQQPIPFLRILQLPQNMGKGAAIAAGVLEASGDWIVFMDADGATPITELPKMKQALQEAQIGIGNRWMKGAKVHRSSVFRHLSGWLNKTYMGLFGIGRIDTMCGFKGYRRSTARDLFSNLLEKRWLFDTEIAYKAVKRGYTIKNFPIEWESVEGSKLSPAELIKSGLAIWPLLRRIKKQ